MLTNHPPERAGNRVAIAALYEAHFERVVRYIAVRIGNQSDAEDLASEVFLRAWKAAENYRDTGAPPEAWLFRIAHNIVVDYLRGKSRRPASVTLDEVFDLGINTNYTERLERSEELQRLALALTRLSSNQQQVLALRFGAGMTAEQVAQVMGKKPGAVRELQSSALKKLRGILGSLNAEG